MHIGPKQQCAELKIDNWEIEKDEHNSIIQLNDVYKGKVPIGSVNNQFYLGQVVSCDGTNKMNIDKRILKGQGIIRDIIHILEGVYLGDFFFETAKLLRNALLVSVLTSQCEIWYNLTKKEIQCLESIDKQLLCKLFQTSKKISASMMMLELGVYPLRYTLIMKRCGVDTCTIC